MDELRRPVHLGVAPPEPEESRCHQRSGEQDDEEHREHLARRKAARLVLVLHRLQPRKLPVVIGRAIIAHRSTPLGFQGRPMTAQLKRIRCIHWHKTSECACDVVPIWKR